MRLFPIAPWAPAAPSAEHTARCDALGLPRGADLRHAGDVVAWGVGELQRSPMPDAYVDIEWAVAGGARRSLRAIVRAAGRDPVAPEHRTGSIAVSGWSLSPSGRQIAALVQRGVLAFDGMRRDLGLLVIDARTEAVEAVPVEPSTHEPALLGVLWVGEDAVVVASSRALWHLQRTPAGWRERARVALDGVGQAALGVHRGRVVALLAGADETAVWTLRDGAFEPLGRVLAHAVSLAVTDGALGLWVAACDPYGFITPSHAERARPFAVLIDEPLPVAPAAPKAPKPALSLVEHRELVPAPGALARDLAWLRPLTSGSTVTHTLREVTVGGRTVEAPPYQNLATFTHRGRWLWCVADGVVRVIDQRAPTWTWEAVIPQAGRPRAVAGLDDDTVAVLQAGYAARKGQGVLLCRRGPRGWQAFHELAVGSHSHVVAHPRRPWFYLSNDQEVALYGVAGDALKRLAAIRLAAPGERRRSLVMTDGAHVWALRAVEGTKELRDPELRVDLARELVCDDGAA